MIDELRTPLLVLVAGVGPLVLIAFVIVVLRAMAKQGRVMFREAFSVPPRRQAASGSRRPSSR